MTNLSQVFTEYGLNEAQQLASAKLLSFTGAIDKYPYAEVIGDNAAKEILEQEYSSSVAALDVLKTITQAKWMRGEGLQRWQQEDSEEMQKNRAELMEVVQQLGVMDEIKPLKEKYDGALVLGATEKAIENRLGFVLQAFKNGAKFDKIYLLGGERELDDVKDEKSKAEGAKTEIEMMEKTIARESKNWPEELRNVEVVVVPTPKVKASTIDILQTFLQQVGDDKHMDVLGFSSQPHVEAQKEAIQGGLAGSNITVDVVGKGIKDKDNIERVNTVLDSQARRIYAGYQRVSEVLAEKSREKQVS